MAEFADIVFLAVKPQYFEEVLAQIRPSVRQQIFVSLAPGKTLAWLGERLGDGVKVIRTMPNTPAMVGAGMTAVCKNEAVTQEEADRVCRLCDSFGKTEMVPESLIDVAIGQALTHFAQRIQV